MSAVLERTKKRYFKVMKIALLALICGSGVIVLMQSLQVGLSFFLGGLASFLPQCLFIYWVFFRRTGKKTQKITAFYRGEGLKWLATIVLVVAMLKGIAELDTMLFFAGYFVLLLVNSLLPLIINGQAE